MDVVSNNRIAWHCISDMIIAAPVEKVWEIGSNWLGLPARFCLLEHTQGKSGRPGCVRKLTAISRSGNSGPEKQQQQRRWVTEKLTHIDHSKHILFHDLGGNVGLEPGYQAAFQAIEDGKVKTRVVWPFRFSPHQGAIEHLTQIIAGRVTAYIQELETVACAS